MQNVRQSENRNVDKVNVQLDVVKSSTPQSSASSPAKSETETYSGAPAKYMTDSSESEDDSVSEAEMEEEAGGSESKFMLAHDDSERPADPEMQARLEALLEAAGISKLSCEGKQLADPEVLRRLTSSVSCALDEAAAALTRMRSDQPAPPHPHHHRHHLQDKPSQCGTAANGAAAGLGPPVGADGAPSLAEACSDGDVGTVRKLLTEGRSVHETTEEGESLLSLACSAGYYELAQVLLAMHANVEDRGIKGDCTPLMEAASAGHVDIVRLLVAHGADVNAVSSSGNTPLMYACAGGHETCVQALLEAGANVEDHNENGHTPLMEAASAGHVVVAKILLDHGAGINTHSNEFKESALTLACYKGHLDMVRFLLAAGADREHKTDEMHTALMEASMDGHVEVARLLLDSGAQVNMPTDSFESPLTLAACGGHVELAMLLLERGANIEEVNDEGYTPLMEAAREGHEEMVALLLGQGASINAQTDETQETALTLACCGGFLEVADFLIKAGADAELGASTPLMEASQEGHLELVRYLLNAGADAHAQTQTGDTALTYACENGHTDVADLLLHYGANLEHESEGGRTPLMKACRAGHLCTVQFLVGKGADVNRMTASGDHTPLSLACAGGHTDVVKFLLACDADPFRKLKDNSTMLIEAAKGGHTAVVQLLLDYPHSVMMARNGPAAGAPAPAPAPTPAPAPATDDPLNPTGLSPAQAAQLGLSHVPAPGAPHQRAIVPTTPAPTSGVGTAPTHPPHAQNNFAKFNMGYMDAHKKQQGGMTQAVAPAAGTKHKCPRKQRGVPPQTDHHLPPPPDIHDDQRVEMMMAPQQNETLPEAERGPLEHVEAAGPPTLATSALHALHLQFCAQGVTTTHPYPQQQQPFPPQQLVTNVSQHQLQELQQQQLQQLTAQKFRQHCMDQHGQYDHLMQMRPDAYPPQSGSAGGGGSEEVGGGADARELGAVLAYLQREVPSLFALPPNELRSLVLQVMQQKSHEILSQKCTEGPAGMGAGGDGVGAQLDAASEEQARRMLAAAAAEGALADWPQDHQHLMPVSGHGECPYRLRPPSPASALEAPALALPRPPDDSEPPAEPVAPFVLPTPTVPYDVAYRPTATFAPPLAPTGAPVAAPVPVPTAQPPHGKRDVASSAHINTSLPAKKKGRFATSSRSGGGGGAPGRAPEPAATYAQPPHPATGAAVAATYPTIDVDCETDSNHDTALTLACAGGHEELVELLLSRGANIEHRDKKGFTPLILAATAGHEKIVEILLNHDADIEAQSERTKDTPLSLACSGGRYEVVELILSRGANKEHRNVSDYTPLSLAASGGYVNIIRLLLHNQAEINSRTGSKLGISPLMLAAMNGHTAAVRLLLDCGSDINAQIETNRNTALTLACFQGRHEVVSLLLDRKANVEHRAKTGLTPLMEAASGGYVEVGRVLLDKGADVNAPPVPSSRDTALTIAADKGHVKFVELLLQRRAAVEVKNKKGNSPLWLAANGGHLAVVEMLYEAGADIDSQDNRKVSCLMAAFRKGHTKVVKWMVDVVTQFPSDQEMTRYICTISDKELLEKCQECVRVIRAAKETQAARAYQNATILLEELDAERCREESRRQAAARRRERKKKKKLEKKERRKLLEENDKNSMYSEKASGECSEGGEPEEEPAHTKEEGDSGIDANSQGSCSSSDAKPPPTQTTKAKKKKKEATGSGSAGNAPPPMAAPVPAPEPLPHPTKLPDKMKSKIDMKLEKDTSAKSDKKQEKENVAPSEPPSTPARREPAAPAADRRPVDKRDKKPEEDNSKTITVQNVTNKYGNNSRKSQVFESTRLNVDSDDPIDKNKKMHSSHQWETAESKSTSPGAAAKVGGCAGGRREEGWKEVVRKSSVQTLSTVEPGCKKVSVASHAISRVIGRAGSNINAIRSATGAHIEVDKQSKGQGERIITIKGSAEATKQAASLIAAMIRDPDADITQLLSRGKLPAPALQPLQPKQPKQPTAKGASASGSGVGSGGRTASVRPATKQHATHATTRAPPPRLTAQVEKRIVTSTSATPVSSTAKASALTYTGAIVGTRSHTFAAKVTAATRMLHQQPTATSTPSAPPTPVPSPLKPTSAPVAHASPPAPPPPVSAPAQLDTELDTAHRARALHLQLSPESGSSWSNNDDTSSSHSSTLHINTSTPSSSMGSGVGVVGSSTNSSGGGASAGGSGAAAEYVLFKKLSGAAGVWGVNDAAHDPEPPPPQVDASKAPGYRGGAGAGGGCSPCSRTSSHGSTPPPGATPSYHTPLEPALKHPAVQRDRPPQSAPAPARPPSIGNSVSGIDMSGLTRNGPIYSDNSRNGHNIMVSMSSNTQMGLGYVGVEGVSRLNPRAPDFPPRTPTTMHHHKPNTQLFGNASSGSNTGAGGPGAGGANLNTLLMYQPSVPPKHMSQPQPHMPYQSLLERGVSVGVGGWNGEEEERKPRPIGTERAWKLTASDDWSAAAAHAHHPYQMANDHDRYQNISGMGGMGVNMSVGVGGVESVYGGVGVGGGAAAAALSLMHALPLQYLPGAPPAAPPPPQLHTDHANWDHPHRLAPTSAADKTGWSKWTH